MDDQEMEHYLMFPEDYCRRCEGGRGPLCDDCLQAEFESGWDDYDYEDD